MMIKNFGARVVSAWEGLRPMTKKMIAGAMQPNIITNNPSVPQQKFSYDAHVDWELSRLLSALDEQTADADVKKDVEKLGEIKQFAEACADVLESQTESAEGFILLAERALSHRDYKKIDELADALFKRFSIGEMCEIARQASNPAIRAIAYETLVLMPTASLMPMLADPLYHEVARNTLEQQAFEYESEEARRFLEQIEFEDEIGGL
jgi:MoxR-like ATPase